jgi:amino acid transporter
MAHVLSSVPRPTGGPVWATVLGAGTSIAIVLSFANSPDTLTQLLGAASLMPALLYASTVVLFIATRHEYRHHPDDFTLGKWEWPVVAGAVVWLAIEVCIFLIPDDFRTAQKYAVGSLVIGAVVFAIVMATNREALRAEAGVEVDRL